MRIAFVHPRSPSAEGTGATHSATQIVTGLVDAGHEVCVYCPRAPKDDAGRDAMESRHLTGNSNHPHTDTQLNREIIARKDELREFDILHSYLPRLIPSVAKVGKDSDIATVVTMNAYGGTCAKNDLLYLDRKKCREKSMLKCLNCISRTGLDGDDYGYAYQLVSQLFSLRLIDDGEKLLEHIDGYHALSPHVREAYVDFGYDRDKIEVIPNILDSRFDVEHESDFREPFNLLYVGALKKRKGVDRLIDAVSAVSGRTDVDVSLTIVGDGPLENALRQEIEQEGINEAVEMRGHVSYSELPDVYANHDLFVYPGRWDEPFGRVFLEAMATGTPVVSTDVGSVADIIEGAGNVSKRDTADFVDVILSVLDYRTLRKYSEVGRQRAEMYRESAALPQFEQLYAEIV